MTWDETKQPKKTIEKHFFRGKGARPIPPDYREDLKALALADGLGAVPRYREIKEAKIENYHCFARLIQEVAEELENRKEQETVEKRIKSIWNGHSVNRYFDVKGEKIGDLVRIGQEYVRHCFEKGDDSIREEDVKDYVRNKVK